MKKRGVSVDEARALLQSFDDVTQGRKYGYPCYLVDDRFFARFRDDDSVLVLQIASIDEREVLMQLDADAFFFTDHYKNYPSVLIRLAEVPRPLFTDVVNAAWRHLSAARPARRRRSTTSRSR